jgi:hypothetical protein
MLILENHISRIRFEFPQHDATHTAASDKSSFCRVRLWKLSDGVLSTRIACRIHLSTPRVFRVYPRAFSRQAPTSPNQEYVVFVNVIEWGFAYFKKRAPPSLFAPSRFRNHTSFCKAELIHDSLVVLRSPSASHCICTPQTLHSQSFRCSGAVEFPV